jgi:hypothetical protein
MTLNEYLTQGLTYQAPHKGTPRVLIADMTPRERQLAQMWMVTNSAEIKAASIAEAVGALAPVEKLLHEIGKTPQMYVTGTALYRALEGL